MYLSMYVCMCEIAFLHLKNIKTKVKESIHIKNVSKNNLSD